MASPGPYRAIILSTRVEIPANEPDRRRRMRRISHPPPAHRGGPSMPRDRAVRISTAASEGKGTPVSNDGTRSSRRNSRALPMRTRSPRERVSITKTERATRPALPTGGRTAMTRCASHPLKEWTVDTLSLESSTEKFVFREVAIRHGGSALPSCFESRTAPVDVTGKMWFELRPCSASSRTKAEPKATDGTRTATSRGWKCVSDLHISMTRRAEPAAAEFRIGRQNAHGSLRRQKAFFGHLHR